MFEISPMSQEDLDAVLEIEKLGQPSPWTRKIFEDELVREWARLDVIRLASSTGDVRVAAFSNYWLVHDEVHLLNVGTHPEFRRRGLARALVQHLIDFGRRHECRYVTLEVRRSNAGAISLYEGQGFAQVGVRPGYYAEDREDALVMLLHLEGAGSPAEHN